jgi:hypothetical protein
MSVVDGEVNLQYQYRQQAGLDWTASRTNSTA